LLDRDYLNQMSRRRRSKRRAIGGRI
jgi:hypothetical protein